MLIEQMLNVLSQHALLAGSYFNHETAVNTKEAYTYIGEDSTGSECKVIRDVDMSLGPSTIIKNKVFP